MAAPLRSIQTIPRPGLSFEAPLYGWQGADKGEIAKAIDRAVRGTLGEKPEPSQPAVQDQPR
jgi:hypothetical protein